MTEKETDKEQVVFRYNLSGEKIQEIENGGKTLAEAFFTTKAIGRDPMKLCPLLGVDKERFARPHQIHGFQTRQIAEEFFLLGDGVRKMLLDGVDAVIYNVKNACSGMSRAECIPVVVYDTEHHCAAAIHAGWRGTLERIVVRAIENLSKSFRTKPENLRCIIGPGISMESFEVGEEVYDAFLQKGFPVDSFAVRRLAKHNRTSENLSADIPWKWHLDIKECNRQQLISLGVKEENIIILDVDTMTDERFYSARREGAETGRMLSGIILR